MKLSLVWWNTSLVPLSKSPPTEPQLNIVCRVLEWFVEGLQPDFIALGEINDDSFDYLERNSTISGFQWINLSTSGKLAFDTCVLIREQKLQLLDHQDLIVRRAASSTKIGQRLNIGIVDEEQTWAVFMSHWPSHPRFEDAPRQALGSSLRYEVNELLKPNNSTPVILLGDYNAEPFSNSLTTGLESTRDRARLRQKPLLLYNPFWRHLGEAKTYKQGVNVKSKNRCGSHYYKSGSLTRWHTFDQMLFSSCFMGGGAWHLNEELTGIIDMPSLLNLVIDPKQKFDHLPVISVLEKEVSHD